MYGTTETNKQQKIHKQSFGVQIQIHRYSESDILSGRMKMPGNTIIRVYLTETHVHCAIYHIVVC